VRRAAALSGIGILTLLGALLGFQPVDLIQAIDMRKPGVVYSIDTQRPAVALTLDDGPDAATTPALLDLLRRHGARATFFLLADNVPGNEELLRRMAAEGHELGNHLVTDEPSILLGPEGFQRAVEHTHDLLEEYGEVRWLRPGSGWYNGPMLQTAGRHGYRVALGSVYPFDAMLPFPGLAARYILWRARPGSIIVLHDVGSRGERTLATLESVLPELKRRGFQVITLSELSALGD
jgi:peptidoglycan/xylan/chitin deacetylase (PgdA/CDA1 family)